MGANFEAMPRPTAATVSRAFCKVPTSRPGKWASFMLVQSNVLALSVNADPGAVMALTPRRINNPPPLPPEPVWVKIARYLLSDPKALPAPARIIAMALASTDEVTFSAGADSAHPGQYQVRMEAKCRNWAIADTARKQLEIQTRMLAIELMREHRQPDPADLTGLLTAGTFWVRETSVLGNWPLRRELLDRLK